MNEQPCGCLDLSWNVDPISCRCLLWDKPTTENALPTASRLLWETTQLHLVWFRYSILYTSYLKHRDFPHPLVCCCVPISTGFNPYFFRVSSFDPKFMVFNSNVCWFNLHLCCLFVSMLMNIHPHCCCWSHPQINEPRPWHCPGRRQSYRSHPVAKRQALAQNRWGIRPTGLSCGSLLNGDKWWDDLWNNGPTNEKSTKVCTFKLRSCKQLQIAVESQNGVSGDPIWMENPMFLFGIASANSGCAETAGTAGTSRRPPSMWGQAQHVWRHDSIIILAIVIGYIIYIYIHPLVNKHSYWK